MRGFLEECLHASHCVFFLSSIMFLEDVIVMSMHVDLATVAYHTKLLKTSAVRYVVSPEIVRV